VPARRHGKGCLGRQALVRGDGVDVAGFESVPDPVVGGPGPSPHRGVPVAAVEVPEVVNDPAAAEEQDSRRREWRQGPGEREEVRGLAGADKDTATTGTSARG